MIKKILLLFCVLPFIGSALWSLLACFPGPPRPDFAGFSTTGVGYIGGGRRAGPFNSLSDWQQFNPIANSWSAVTAMPYPFTALNAFAINGDGYVVNGVNDATYNYDTFKFNSAGNNWSTEAAFSYPRLYATSAALGNKAYVIGGYGFAAEPLKDLWEYDALLNNWTERQALPLSSARHDATGFSAAGNVYVFGGTDDMSYLHDLWKHDTTLN